MDEEKALTEAQRLWGPGAYVFDRETNKYQSTLIKRYGRFYVGNPTLVGRFPYGNGDTWEEAFENVKKA